MQLMFWKQDSEKGILHENRNDLFVVVVGLALVLAGVNL